MEKILREVLAEDRNILARRDDLIATLNARVPSELRRNYASIRKALELNVGEVFAVGGEDHEAAKAKATQILKDSGMQEARVNIVVETFVKALDWDKAPELPPEDEFEDEVEVEPPPPPPPIVEPPPPEPPPPPQPEPEPPKISTPPPTNPQPAPESKSNGGLIAIIGVLLVIIFFVARGNSSNDNGDTPRPAPEPVAQVSEPVRQPEPEPVKKPEPPPVKEDTSYLNAKSELSLNGMDLRIDIQRVWDILGSPNSAESSGGYDRYNYRNIEVIVTGGKIDAFVAKSSEFKTRRGLHVGSNYGEVVGAYGEAQHVMEIDNLILYEYDFSAIDNHEGLLRFAVNKSDNRVNYISVRIIDNAPPQENKSDGIDENTRQAAEAFVAYHRAITNGNFSAAYNMMTEGRKDFMGTPQQFASGYRTTISSVITELNLVSTSSDVVVMDYILEARDRADNGQTIYRKFSGQVRMSKIFGAWKVGEVESKKISEVIER